MSDTRRQPRARVMSQSEPMPDTGFDSSRSLSPRSYHARSVHDLVANVARQGTSSSGDEHDSSDVHRLIREPDIASITTDQLIDEVRSIYSSLVFVEANCIRLDDEYAAEPESMLNGVEKLQYVLALHGKLVGDHHDFLLATNHPVADESMRGLADKYAMPLRLWKHGIYTMLELLRNQLPASREYLVEFLNASYKAIALFHESVAAFKDLWTECLGDLARYGMTIAEDEDTHITWRSTAARWYTLTNDAHPNNGRMSHHLGVLEHLGIQKFCLYSKSLTCVVPFQNARGSLTDLCNLILSRGEKVPGTNPPTEVKIMYHLALEFTGSSAEMTISNASEDALTSLRQEPASFFLHAGPSLAITNVAALFEFGLINNSYRVVFANAIIQAMRREDQAVSHQTDHHENAVSSTNAEDDPISHDSFPAPSSVEFCKSCFEHALYQTKDQVAIQSASAFVHIMLVWVLGVVSLRQWLEQPRHIALHSALACTVLENTVPWSSLARFLNRLIEFEPISDRVMSSRMAASFPQPENGNRPLTEDYTLRGLIWSDWYFKSVWFYPGPVDDGDRDIETQATHALRAERIQWLGLQLTMYTEKLRYDDARQLFVAVT